MSARAVGMVVGEGPERDDFSIQLVQAPPEGLRPADPGEGAHLLSLKRGRREETARSPLDDSQRPVESPERGHVRDLRKRWFRLSAAACPDEKMGSTQGLRGFAKRSPGKEPTVSEGTRRVDQDDIEIPVERPVLEGIV